MDRLFKRPEISLTVIILVICLACNVVFGLIIGNVANQSSTEAMLDSAMFYTERIVAQTITNLDDYMREYALLLSALSKNGNLIYSIQNKGILKLEDRLFYEKQYFVYLEHIMNSKSDTAGILIVGSNGYLYSNDALSMVNTDYDFLNAPWYLETLQYDAANPLNITSIYVDFYRKHSQLYGKTIPALNCPIYGYDGQKIGVVYCFLFPELLQKSLYLDDFEEFGGVFLINKENQVVLHSNNAMINSIFEGHVLSNTGALGQLSRISPAALNGSVYVKTLSKYLAAEAVCEISLDTINLRVQGYRARVQQGIYLGIGMAFLISLMCYLFIRYATQRMMAELSKMDTLQATYTHQHSPIREYNRISEQFQQLLTDITSLNQKNYDIALSAQVAKLNMLVSQMNPHFLFNTLQLLQTELVVGKPEQADFVLVSLSRLLRYAVDQRSVAVPLDEELKFVSSYMNIVTARFGDRLHFDVYCPDSLKSAIVPKFLIQPIIENAIIHGFSDDPHDGRITLSFMEHHDQIILWIMDNGDGLSPAGLEAVRQSLNAPQEHKQTDSIGLGNIHHRIQLLCGTAYGLTVDSVEHQYTKVNIVIPRHLKSEALYMSSQSLQQADERKGEDPIV